jgi:hypothetical protein
MLQNIIVATRFQLRFYSFADFINAQNQAQFIEVSEFL